MRVGSPTVTGRRLGVQADMQGGGRWRGGACRQSLPVATTFSVKSEAKSSTKAEHMGGEEESVTESSRGVQE